MRIWPIAGHRRFEDDASAYADGALDGRALAAFERHLDGCARCRDAVEAERGLRVELAALPEIEPPRSFRLYPGLLDAPARAAKPAGRWLPRTAQALAAVAVVAFISVLTIDLTRGNSSDGGGTTTAARDSASESGGASEGTGGPGAAAAPNAAPESTTTAALTAGDTASPTIPTFTDNEAQASGITTPSAPPTPVAPRTGPGNPEDATPGPPDTYAAGTSATPVDGQEQRDAALAGGADALGGTPGAEQPKSAIDSPAVAPQAAASTSGDSEDTTFLALEIALAASSIGAAIAAIGLSRRNRRH